MATKKESQVLPERVFMARGADGKVHFYSQDPMRIHDRSKIEIDLGERLISFYGNCDPVNPLVFKTVGLVEKRSEPFDASIPEKIRKGLISKHLEDMDGNYIDILSIPSPDENYRINSVVVTKDGEIIEQRYFNGRGECSDGIEYHNILVMDGVYIGDVVKGPVGVDKSADKYLEDSVGASVDEEPDVENTDNVEMNL